MSIFVLSTTEKNKPLLICKRYNYTIDKTNDTKVYWKCEYCRTIKCKGRIHSDINFTTILHENDAHNHPPKVANTEVRMFHDKIRTRVITTHEGTQCVIDNFLKDTSNEMVALLP
ncbi:unnamed protein product, partial [Rotaria sp. Silwood2]